MTKKLANTILIASLVSLTKYLVTNIDGTKDNANPSKKTINKIRPFIILYYCDFI